MSIFNKNQKPYDFDTKTKDENAAVCQSGLGDGFYPVIVGKYRNQIVCVIVDFFFDDEEENEENVLAEQE